MTSQCRLSVQKRTLLHMCLETEYLKNNYLENWLMP